MSRALDYASSLSENPYFGAGAGLAGLGIGAAILRRGGQIASVYFRRHYLMTLEVPCRDKSYQWILQWITMKGARKTQHLSVETSFEQFESGHTVTKYDFIPSIGTHFFKHNNSWIKVVRTREQSTIDLQMGIPFETVQLTALGNKRELFFSILEEARELALTKTEGKTIIYDAFGSEWRVSGDPLKRRPISSVVLHDGIAEKIIKDMKEFIANPAWYNDRGIPYRRGYLLYGPPGCGKTSFITAIAGELEHGICELNFSDRGLTDDRLKHLLRTAPKNSVILLEDVDSAFGNREDTPEMQTAYQGLTRVTLSGFLNCLDGVSSAEGRILFMTTNYVDRLDPALIRPGRVDFKEYIGHCSESQIVRLYKRFYQNVSDYEAQSFADAVLKYQKPVSPAQLQGFFLVHKTDDFNTLIQDLESIWKKL